MAIGSAAKNSSHTKRQESRLCVLKPAADYPTGPCKKQRGLVNQAPPEGCQNA